MEMSSNASEGVVQMGKLVVHIAENGNSFELDCNETTLVEKVQRLLESAARIHLNDQLLLCLDMKLETQRSLSAYKLPSDGREVFLFNRARMRSNSIPPAPEEVDIIEIPDPLSPSSSNDPHPLDDAPDPAVKALPSYERQFRFHFQCGNAIYSSTMAKIEKCHRLLREQKVQEKALWVAKGNLDHFYGMICQNYTAFVKCYSQQQRFHANLLGNFKRDIEKLRFCKLHPVLQTTKRECLLDFVKEENLHKLVEDCSSAHRQLENKVTEFKLEFEELRHNAEQLFSSKASVHIKELETTIKDHQRCINEEKSIMQALSKDVNTVKKLVDDCLTSKFSSSLRPHDAVSALGPMYECHEKSYLPKMQECDSAISQLLNFCQDKKNEMNTYVHNYMQKIAYIQYTIKDVRYKFSVFQEALKRQNDQFEHMKVVRGIGPAYRACLAEVVRRKAAMKLYMGLAGQLAERLARKREAEVTRREEFLKVHSLYIPHDILASMGLYDNPNQCDVNITPFDMNLLDLDISDLDRYAPESLTGLSSRIEKHGALKSSVSQSTQGETALDVSDNHDADELLEASGFLDIAGTSKIEVENAKLKAELASKIALICSIGNDFDFESLDDSQVGSLLKNAAEKTSHALHLKDEYEKQLQAMLKAKQKQCESYEERIKELEQKLSDQYPSGSNGSDLSSTKNGGIRSEISAIVEAHMSLASPEAINEASCESSSSNVKSAILCKQRKGEECLDDNMLDSSGLLNPWMNSSMLDPQRKEAALRDECLEIPASSMAVSISHPQDASTSDPAIDPCLDSKVNADIVLELQTALTAKSNQVNGMETKLKALNEEVSKLKKELEISRKLLDESQMNCAHLENCLHEAREEAQTHLCAADRRASEYNALRGSAVKLLSLFQRLRNVVLSGGVGCFAESLHALAQSLSNSVNENEDDGNAEFCKCISVLADRVGLLSRNRAELLGSYSKAESMNKQLKKELEEKKELVNTLYKKHQLEKQASKEKISFGRLEVHEIAAFVQSSSGHYQAINRNCSHYYLSAESVALFVDDLPDRPSYIVGQIVHIERQIVRPSVLARVQAERDGDRVDSTSSETRTGRLNRNSGLNTNPCGLALGCEYFIVTVAMLPDTTIH